MLSQRTHSPQINYKLRIQKQNIRIRRSNREQIFSKRRNILPNANNPQLPQHSKLLIVDQRYRTIIEQFLNFDYEIQRFTQLSNAVKHEDIIQQHYGIIGIRKLLSICDNPPIQSVIDSGLIPFMIDFVTQQEYPQLQLEATWALTNVASGNTQQCQVVVEKGGIELFIELVKVENMGIVEQAIWALGNIASDNIFNRDSIIRSGGLNNLVEVYYRLEDDTLIEYCCWAISNLCRGSPLPKYSQVTEAIPVLCKAIATSKIKDTSNLSDCCWAISYHIDSQCNNIIELINTGVVPYIINHLDNHPIDVLIPSIRILGNISTGSAQQTAVILTHDIFIYFQKLLEHPRKAIRRQVCWVLSNITAGTKDQIETVLDRPQLLQKLLQMFKSDSPDIQRQICYIFSNMSRNGQHKQIYDLYTSTNIIQYYMNMLSSNDTKTLQVTLECLYNVLAIGGINCTQNSNFMIVQLHNKGFIQVLEQLQLHPSDTVYENVSNILETYFQIQDQVRP